MPVLLLLLLLYIIITAIIIITVNHHLFSKDLIIFQLCAEKVAKGQVGCQRGDVTFRGEDLHVQVE